MPETAEKPRKNIVICCDGTGNEFGPSNSNVVKLYTALTINNDQIGYYHPGVGTMGAAATHGLSQWWTKVAGLGFGKGFMPNVEDAYRYLMEHYDDGDRVYLFGFSRGAYTARAIAAILHAYGLLCRGNEGQFPYLWKMFKDEMATARKTKQPMLQISGEFKETFSRPVNLHFVGLWDTVSSVGWVTEPVKLLYSAQNPSIQRGRHAISIDERRCFFVDNLWGDPLPKDDAGWQKMLHELWDGPDAEHPKIPPDDPRWQQKQDIFQVWFSGVHSDVGGSYAQAESALANETLQWMLKEAEAAGLRVDRDRVDMLLGRKTKKVYAAAGYYKTPEPGWETQKIHVSLRQWWWLLEILPHVYYDKDDSGTEKRRIPLGRPREIPYGSVVHGSVVTRMEIAANGYHPVNLGAGKLRPLSSGGSEGYYTYNRDEAEEAAPSGSGTQPAKGLAAALAAAAVLGLLAKRFLMRG